MKSRAQKLLENKIRKMVREELLYESYIESELNKLDPTGNETIKIILTQSGTRTKYLNLDASTIPELIKFLEYVNEKFSSKKGGFGPYGPPNTGI